MPTTPLVCSPRIRVASGLPVIEPINPVPRPDPFDDPAWIFEPKYDGFRGVVYATSAGCEIRSRRDIPLRRFQGLWDRLREVLGPREVILDGVVVSLNRQGKPVFENLMRGRGFLAFAAFDLLWLDGEDLRGKQLAERKHLLAGLLPEDTGPLYKILAIEEHGRALFGAIRKMDLEGVVAKRKTDRYQAGATWYKIRNEGHSRGESRAEPFLQSARPALSEARDISSG
jgi:bifunctional non-homologous end joining protein LigD